MSVLLSKNPSRRHSAPPDYNFRNPPSIGKIVVDRPTRVGLWDAAVVAVALLVLDSLLARHNTGGVVFDLYWLAFFLGLATAVVFGWQTTSAPARAWGLVAFAVFTYIPKFLMSATGPRYFDEYGQFRHVNDALRTGNVFEPNTYQPIISRFPGLTVATLAVHAVTRLSAWHSGQVVILAAHAAALPIVAAIARRVGASERMAFLGALVYAINPSFSFFDAEYSYESLGLPLAFLVILACLSTLDPSGTRTGRGSTRTPELLTRASDWPAVGVVAFTACVLTHHLSSLFADATCLLLATSLSVAVSRQQAAYRLSAPYRLRAGWQLVTYGVVATSLWLWLAASSLSSYLAPHFSGAIVDLLEIIGVEDQPVTSGAIPTKRTLFAGSQLPFYEKVAAITTPFLALILVLGSVWILWKTRRAHPRSGALLVPFVLLAMAYFVSLPFSLTTAGSEISHRSWGYSYLGIAVVVAAAASRFAEIPRPSGVRTVAIAAAMIVPLAMGNTALGVDVSYRFPGPYEFGTDTRSGSPELNGVVAWLNAHVPPGTGVLADRFTVEYVNGYTRLRIPSPTQILPLALYAEPLDPSPRVAQALTQGGFKYFVLDKHILTVKPMIEIYPGATSFLPVDVSGLRALVAGRTGTADVRSVYANAGYDIFRIGS